MNPSDLKHIYEERFREAGYPAVVEVSGDMTLQRVIFEGDTARHILPLAEGFSKPALGPQDEPLDDPETIRFNDRLRDRLLQVFMRLVKVNFAAGGGVEINNHLVQFRNIRTGARGPHLTLVRGVRICFSENQEFSLQVAKGATDVTTEDFKDFVSQVLGAANCTLVANWFK